MSFTKLDKGIIHSSLWSEPDSVRLLFITMLVLADSEGVVDCCLKHLEQMARLNRMEVEAALSSLTAPDKDSKDTGYEGRRIEKIDRGWLILNYKKFQTKLSDNSYSVGARKRMKKHRMGKCGISTDEKVCAYCGGNASGVDHIVPKSRGGKDSSDNAVPCCLRCNRAKSTMELSDFLNTKSNDFINHYLVLGNTTLMSHVSCDGMKYINVTSCNK